MTSLDSMLGALLGAPSLPGARCRGRPHLFDEQHPGEPDHIAAQRHHQALSLCAACPSLPACTTYFESLPPAHKPGGVIAGRIHRWATTTRPRRTP